MRCNELQNSLILASSTSDLSGTAVPAAGTRDHVSGLPDPIDGRSQYVVNNAAKFP